jgi:hypothetical protein
VRKQTAEPPTNTPAGGKGGARGRAELREHALRHARRMLAGAADRRFGSGRPRASFG